MLRRTLVLALVLTSCTDQGAHSSTTGPDGEPLIAESAQLNCDGQIRQDASPPSDYEIIGGGVALATSTSQASTFQTAPTQDRDPATRLYAKTGLEVRDGAVSEIIVPPQSIGRVSLQWGGRPTTHLIVGPCAANGAWIVFPGGYLVPQVGCFDIIVRATNVDHEYSVGVGSPCPGQTPPIGISET